MRTVLIGILAILMLGSSRIVFNTPDPRYLRNEELANNYYLSWAGYHFDSRSDNFPQFFKQIGKYSLGQVPPLSDTGINKTRDSISGIGYQIKKSLPDGYVLDGTIDYTSYLQKAIDAHRLLVFPGFPILINEKGLQIPSGRKIVFLPGSKLILKPNAKPKYSMVLMKGQSDIDLYDPVIVGDRFQHLNSEGEWGMGISVISSNHINIYNPDISNCWGDGLYISQLRISPPPTDILIKDAICHQNRRNGITLISGINVKFINPKISFNDGTSPGAGIDIEPNYTYNEIKNLLIQSLQTKANRGASIQITLDKLFKDGVKYINIDINNPKDIGSGRGLVVSGWPAKEYLDLHGKKDDSKGYISIKNPLWINSKIQPMKIRNFRAIHILLQISNPIIKDTNLNINSADYLRGEQKIISRKGGNIEIKE